MPGTRELLAHIDFVQLFDGMPIEMHPPRHVLDCHRPAQSADLHGKPQGVLWLVRQEVEFFVLHAACFAFYAVHVKNRDRRLGLRSQDRAPAASVYRKGCDKFSRTRCKPFF